MLKPMDKLIDTIENHIQSVGENKKGVSEIKAHLRKNGIIGSDVENILTNPQELHETDAKEVALLTQQFYVKTGIEELNPNKWFTDNEMRQAKQFDKNALREQEDGAELIFPNTNRISNGVYVTSISSNTIAELLNNQKLNYNFNIQRQAKVKRHGDQIIQTATVYKKNVKEISELMIKGQLVPTLLAFNAPLGSSESGEELVYDSSTKTLTVSQGTILDILDGYHRCLASEKVARRNPDVEFEFMLMISNYSESQARQYQSQLAKASPIPKTRVQELEANRLADRVVAQLKIDSELKDRISSSHMVSTSSGQLVSYNVIADAIDREFEMKNNLEVKEVVKYLKEFFDYLIGYYQDQFDDVDSKSLIAYNKMFAGYIALAAEMKKNDIKLDTLNEIIDTIDFSRNNEYWSKVGIVDDYGAIKRKVDEFKIAKYFKGLIKETVA